MVLNTQTYKWWDGWMDCGYLRLPVCLEHLTVLIKATAANCHDRNCNAFGAFERIKNRQTSKCRQTDRQSNRHTNTQTNRPRNKQKRQQTNRNTNRRQRNKQTIMISRHFRPLYYLHWHHSIFYWAAFVHAYLITQKKNSFEVNIHSQLAFEILKHPIVACSRMPHSIYCQNNGHKLLDCLRSPPFLLNAKIMYIKLEWWMIYDEVLGGVKTRGDDGFERNISFSHVLWFLTRRQYNVKSFGMKKWHDYSLNPTNCLSVWNGTRLKGQNEILDPNVSQLRQ